MVQGAGGGTTISAPDSHVNPEKALHFSVKHVKSRYIYTRSSSVYHFNVLLYHWISTPSHFTVTLFHCMIEMCMPYYFKSSINKELEEVGSAIADSFTKTRASVRSYPAH